MTNGILVKKLIQTVFIIVGAFKHLNVCFYIFLKSDILYCLAATSRQRFPWSVEENAKSSAACTPPLLEAPRKPSTLACATFATDTTEVRY